MEQVKLVNSLIKKANVFTNTKVDEWTEADLNEYVIIIKNIGRGIGLEGGSGKKEQKEISGFLKDIKTPVFKNLITPKLKGDLQVRKPSKTTTRGGLITALQSAKNKIKDKFPIGQARQGAKTIINRAFKEIDENKKLKSEVGETMESMIKKIEEEEDDDPEISEVEKTMESMIKKIEEEDEKELFNNDPEVRDLLEQSGAFESKNRNVSDFLGTIEPPPELRLTPLRSQLPRGIDLSGAREKIRKRVRFEDPVGEFKRDVEISRAFESQDDTAFPHLDVQFSEGKDITFLEEKRRVDSTGRLDLIEERRRDFRDIADEIALLNEQNAREGFHRFTTPPRRTPPGLDNFITPPTNEGFHNIINRFGELEEFKITSEGKEEKVMGIVEDIENKLNLLRSNEDEGFIEASSFGGRQRPGEKRGGNPDDDGKNDDEDFRNQFKTLLKNDDVDKPNSLFPFLSPTIGITGLAQLRRGRDKIQDLTPARAVSQVNMVRESTRSISKDINLLVPS